MMDPSPASPESTGVIVESYGHDDHLSPNNVNYQGNGTFNDEDNHEEKNRTATSAGATRSIIALNVLYVGLVVALFVVPRFYVSKELDGFTQIAQGLQIIFIIGGLVILVAVITLIVTCVYFRRLSCMMRLLGIFPMIASGIIVAIIVVMQRLGMEEAVNPICTYEDTTLCPTFSSDDGKNGTMTLTPIDKSNTTAPETIFNNDTAVGVDDNETEPEITIDNDEIVNGTNSSSNNLRHRYGF